MARPRPDPDPRRRSCRSSSRQYEAQAARARRPRRRRAPRPAPRAARDHPGQRHQPGGRPGRQLRARARRDIRAVYVTDDLDAADALRARWERQLPDVPLVIVESPFRAVISPVVAYLDILDQAWPPDKEAPITIVVLPEYVARHWWDRLLYNQTAKRLKAELVGREHTVIADVPYRRGPLSGDRADPVAGGRRRDRAGRRPDRGAPDPRPTAPVVS